MKIFISYGRKDALELAIKLSNWLRQQGYEPWVDVENGISIGEPFDIRIEIGISGSKILIVLLSPWSLRPEGFCRNELLFAQAHKIPIVPIRIADIIPPIQIISLNYIDAFHDPEGVFKLLPPIIEQVVATGSMPLRDWKTDHGDKVWWATREELNFQEELKRYGGSFTGREWLFREIDSWIKRPDSRMLFIIGDAGVGKSAIAAQMTTRLNVRGVHFCSGSNFKSCFPKAWLSELVFQLAAQFDVYRREIEGLCEPHWGDPPESLFRMLIVDPLRKHNTKLGTGKPLVFVIDGLDESLAEAGSGLTDLLTRSVGRIPECLRIIVTSRPHQTLIARFSISGVQQLKLAGKGKQNKDDLHSYVEKRCQHSKVEKDSLHFSEKILEMAAGNFLFARVVMDSLSEFGNTDNLNLQDISTFPKNLVGLYDNMIRSRFKDKDKYEKEVLPLLNCLVAAKGPMPETLLLKASQLDEFTASKGLLALSQFLNRTDGGLTLFHRSMADWLTDLNTSTDFKVSVPVGHKLLADACWSEYITSPQKMSPYSLDYLPIHLIKAERWNDLFEIVKNPELQLIKKWVDGGESHTGLACLIGLVDYFRKQNIEQEAVAGFATQIARIFSIHGDYNEAEHWLKEAMKETSWFRGRRARAIALHELGSLFLYKRDYHRSGEYYHKALRLCTMGIPVYNDEAAANIVGLSTIANEQYRYDKALVLSAAAIKKAADVGDLLHVIAGERIKGTAYKSLGNFQAAKDHLSTALNICELINARREKHRIMMLQGWLEYDAATLRKEPPHKANLLFEGAMISAKNNYDFYFFTEAQLSLGWVCLLENNGVQAHHNFKSARGYLIPNRHPELKAGIDLGFAATEHHAGKWNDAEALYKDVAQFCKLHDIRTWGYKSLIGLGAIYWHRGHQRDAEETWRSASEVAGSISRGKLNLAEIGIELCKHDPLTPPR